MPQFLRLGEKPKGRKAAKQTQLAITLKLLIHLTRRNIPDQMLAYDLQNKFTFLSAKDTHRSEMWLSRDLQRWFSGDWLVFIKVVKYAEIILET